MWSQTTVVAVGFRNKAAMVALFFVAIHGIKQKD